MITDENHNCERSLAIATARNPKLSDGYAHHGDEWICICGMKFKHACDESAGCFWVAMGFVTPDEVLRGSIKRVQ